jgi:hypothetical protein
MNFEMLKQNLSIHIHLKQFICIIISLILFHFSKAQVTNTAFVDSVGGEKVGRLTISGWLDAYYGKMSPHADKVPYLVSSASLNQVDINLTYLDFRYASNGVKARIVPAFGSYMDANYASEKSGLKNLMEASVGVQLNKQKDIWLEAGLIGSPFTNENPVSRDHLVYTRSMAAELCPYYLMGAKIVAPFSPKIKSSFYLLNGWQTLGPQYQTPALATQLEYNVDKNNLINWNTFVQTGKYHRYFSDIYWIAKRNRWQWTSCFYLGDDPWKDASFGKSPLYEQNGFWVNLNAAVSYQWNETSSISARGEYFRDKFSRIEGSYLGGSLCFNRKIYDMLYWRTEVRYWYKNDQYSENIPNLLWGVMSLGLGF